MNYFSSISHVNVSQDLDFQSYPLCVQNWCNKHWLYPRKGKIFHHVTKLVPLNPFCIKIKELVNLTLVCFGR